MGRLREEMADADDDDFEDLLDDFEENDAERQKQADLARAQARAVARPIKKERRHSQIEGRYIPPEEIKKEVEKLEQAKREAADKKKGFFSRVFGSKEEKIEQSAPVVVVKEKAQNTIDKKPEASLEERKRKAAQIQKLRGIYAEEHEAPEIQEERQPSTLDRQRQDAFDSIPEERSYPSIPKSFSFAQSVARLTAGEGGTLPPVPAAAPFPQITEDEFQDTSDLSEEVEAGRVLFAPVDQGIPDGAIASALSVAAGFIYWDEEDRLVDRIITIRRLFSRNGDILIDALCHDISAPRLIPFSRGVRLYNIQTMASYENPRDFLLYKIAGVGNDSRFNDGPFAAVLSAVRYELAALAFAARADFKKSDNENHLMLTYVSRRCPTIDFDEAEMLDYIAMLVPDEQSFYEALDIVVKQPQDIVLLFVQTFLQMMLSDGVLHENERELLAELLYVVRSEGIELNMLGLE